MSPTTSTPPVELSAWLRVRLAQITRKAEAARLTQPDGARLNVVTFLTPASTPGAEADRTCDACDTYCPEGTDFILFVLRPVEWLTVVGGLCRPCADREGMKA